MKLLLLALLLTNILPGQGSADVVISQIYGGGGNSGATLRSDFIELFNRGRNTVTLDGWSVQYTSATGTEWQITPLQGSIAPGHYVLVAEANGANLAAAALPTPEIIGSIPLSATAGKVALVRSTTALSGTRPTSNVVDFVGYGSDVFEGSGPVGALSNTTAGVRRSGGCVDTDDNRNDFQIAAPQPRNASVAAVDCAAAPRARDARISEIQGTGSASPLVGQLVTTRGVVTAVRTDGLFIQSTPADNDGNPLTSEGLFAYFGSRPPAGAALGNYVQITGTVQEFRSSSDTSGGSLTELVEPLLELLSQGQSLPASVDLPPTAEWEQYEGMLVRVPSVHATSGTLGSVNESTATATSTGVFFGVLSRGTRPFLTPEGAAFYGVLRVDTRGTRAQGVDVTTGDLVNIGGTQPLDYAFGTYSITIDPTQTLVFSTGRQPIPLPAPPAGVFTIAAANLQRLFDEKDDPATSDPVPTLDAFDLRITRISRVIQQLLGSPDVLAVEEVENLDVLKKLASAAGDYDAYLFGGNDVGGIDVGLLVKRSSVQVNSVTQEGKTATQQSGDVLWDRPPLVARVTVRGVPLTVIVVHLRSLLNAETATVAAKRRAQAEALATLIRVRQQAGEQVITLGDFNMFQFDPLMTGILSTTGVRNLTDTLPLSEGYSYVENGVAQTLDHVLVTEGLRSRLYQYRVAHINADFPDTNRNNATSLSRVSDHDFPIANFLVDPTTVQITPAGITNAGSYLSTSLSNMEMLSIFGRNLSGPVLINGSSAPVIFSSSTQMNVVTPQSAAAAQPATVQIGSSNVVQVAVRGQIPALFELGNDQAAILNQDSSVNGAANPATVGTIIQMFGTGTTAGTEVFIGGRKAEIVYNGQAPALGPGVTQMNVRLPQGLPRGRARVLIGAADFISDLYCYVEVE